MAAIIVALTVLAIVGLSLWYLVQPQPLLVQGEADATRVDIAARIDGRVGQRPVSRGDNVTAGQLLVAIDNPELLTKLHEAEAARVVARGGPHSHQGRHARRGGCGTQGRGRGSARPALTLAQQTYDRVKQVTQGGFESVAKLDEATASLDVATRTLEQAKLAYQEAVAGYTAEERGVAQAAVAKAEAAIATLQAQVDEMTVKAPIAGQVYQVGAELGEYVSPGVPLLSLVDLSDVWLRFDLREDLVKGLKVGDRFTVTDPRAWRRARNRRGADHRHPRRVCRMARNARDRRLRSQDLRGAGLSGRQAPRPQARHERLRGLERGALMPSVRRFGIVDVAVREVIWIWRDKVALLLVVVIPLIAFAILAATFSNAVIRDLRVDVVDQDRSKTSETFVQAISSAPGVTVARRSSDLNGAMHAVRSGEAIAAVYIPENLERDITGGRRPQVVIFFNKQFFTPGNVASSSLQAALSAAVADLPAGPRAAAFTPGPLVVEQYVLTNPALNYAQFLLRAILPTVLHIVIAISAGYAVGSEFGSRNMREWLATAGDSMLIALVGKLAPYFGIFLVMMAVGLGIIHGIFEIPFRGDPVLVAAAACLLIIAYLSLGALLQLLVRNLAFGLSLTGIICSPAFGFAGVGFPVLAMNLFARAWGAILPLRWYIQILFDQAARGVPAGDSAEPFMMLGGLAVVYFGLAWLRLRAVGHDSRCQSRPEHRSKTGRAGSALFEHSPTNTPSRSVTAAPSA